MLEKNIQEATPPGPKAEKWVKANKARFKSQYGNRWKEVLYATAWKLFGEESKEKDEEQMASDKLTTGDNYMTETSVALPNQVASQEPDSAVTMRNEVEVSPKHIDVIEDTDLRPYSSNGNIKKGYRFLVQYSTARRPEFFPSLDLPSAPTLEALVALYPNPTCPIMINAVLKAADEPHKRPEFSGNE